MSQPRREVCPDSGECQVNYVKSILPNGDCGYEAERGEPGSEHIFSYSALTMVYW